VIHTPPHLDEIEVSLFGPGYGESVLIHLGRGKWMVVDSCLNKERKPSVLEYLKILGVDPSNAVEQIVATHWHDDHIGGISEILDQCPNAVFICSDAMTTGEFATLATYLDSRGMMGAPGIKQFHRILKTLAARSKAKRGVPVAKLASADKCLWRSSDSEPYVSEVFSLSPSDAANMYARMELAALLEKHKEAIKAVPAPQTPNQAAVALLVKAGNTSLILGADLEETSDKQAGWSAILDSTTTIKGRSSVFKVPHHGSRDSHHDRVWTEILEENPIAIVTPFENGNVFRPELSDMKRITSLTNQAYITAKPRGKQGKVQSSVVNKAMAETVKWIREVPFSTGIVRLRKMALAPSTDPWKVELFGSAQPITACI
jgi:hypothetical protein